MFTEWELGQPSDVYFLLHNCDTLSGFSGWGPGSPTFCAWIEMSDPFVFSPFTPHPPATYLIGSCFNTNVPIACPGSHVMKDCLVKWLTSCIWSIEAGTDPRVAGLDMTTQINGPFMSWAMQARPFLPLSIPGPHVECHSGSRGHMC